MLVDVVELRVRGVKRVVPDIKAAKPIRGWLKLDDKAPLWATGTPRLMASLLDPAQRQSLLEPLDYARVRRIERGSILIVGLQQHVREIRVYENLPQAWWCRPVAGGLR